MTSFALYVALTSIPSTHALVSNVFSVPATSSIMSVFNSNVAGVSSTIDLDCAKYATMYASNFAVYSIADTVCL